MMPKENKNLNDVENSALNISDVSRFAVNERGIFYNCIQHQKEGGCDLPNGNGKYWQKATILNIRKDKYGDEIVDVIFDSGLRSNGHFTKGIEHCY